MKFNKVVHSLEPGETPSYSASHQAPNFVQRSTFLNIVKYLKTVRCGCGAVAFIFSIYLNHSTVTKNVKLSGLTVSESALNNADDVGVRPIWRLVDVDEVQGQGRRGGHTRAFQSPEIKKKIVYVIFR